jgi:hypothetical protein
MSYTVGTITTQSNDPPVDLTNERDVALQGLVDHMDDIVATNGADYYAQIYSDTVAYYEGLGIGPTLVGSSAAGSTIPDPSSATSTTVQESSSLFFDESRAVMRKVPNSSLGVTSEREIRPYLRRLPNETPMFLRMVDSNMQPYGVVMSSGWAVTALKMCPNAESITINSAKIINRYQTMTRWVEAHWGDDIDVINLSGGTFSFFGYGINGRFPGLVAESRYLTESYKWLKELSRLFSVDGFVLQDNRVYEGSIGTLRTEGFVSTAVEQFLLDKDNRSFRDNHPREGLPKERLYMNFVFDYLSCLGYLDTFDISESSTSPYRMTYTLVFKSEKTVWRQGNPSSGAL